VISTDTEVCSEQFTFSKQSGKSITERIQEYVGLPVGPIYLQLMLRLRVCKQTVIIIADRESNDSIVFGIIVALST